MGGGIDSAVVLALLVAMGERPELLFFDYGQSTGVKEMYAVTQLARHYGLRDNVHCLQVDPRLFVCNYTSHGDVRDRKKGPLSLSPSYAPRRNSVLVTLATAWAESYRVPDVFLGIVRGEFGSKLGSSPDTNLEWLQQLEFALQMGGARNVKVNAPLARMRKSQAVDLAVALGCPLDLTWSCHVDGDTHCGACSACIGRREAFARGKVPDPTTYVE